MRTTLTLLIGTIFFSFSVCHAQDASTRTPSKRKAPVRVDRNRDGVITPREQAHATHALRKQIRTTPTASTSSSEESTGSKSTTRTCTATPKRVVDTPTEETFDKNEDGVINRREANRMRWTKRQDDNQDGTVTGKELADTNNDGTVDAKEKKRAKALAEKAIVDTETEERFDKNEDGKINRGEARRMKHFEKTDTNDDGTIDPRERADRNHDGTITPAERHRADVVKTRALRQSKKSESAETK